MREQVPELPPAVEEVVLTALAKDPRQRFTSMQAFAAALEQACQAEVGSYLPLQPALMPPQEQPEHVALGGSPTGQSVLPPLAQHDADDPKLGELRAPVPVHTSPQPTPPLASVPSLQATLFSVTESASPSHAGQAHPVSESERERPSSVPMATSMALPIFTFLRRSLWGKAVFLIALASLVVGSGGLLYTIVRNNGTNLPTNVTAQAGPNAATEARISATALAQATVTAAARAYANAVTASGMMAGFDAQHTGFNPYEKVLTPLNVSELVQNWTASTEFSDITSPTVADGVVYIGSSGSANSRGKLYAFKASGCGTASCPLLWTASANGEINSTPAVANGVVYIGSSDNKLYAFKASGCGQPSCLPLWTATTGNAVFSSPTIADGMVYVGSDDGKLYAFKASGCGSTSCSPLWAASMRTPTSFQNYEAAVLSSPAVAGGVVYAVSTDGILFAFQAAGCGQLSCLPLWTASTGTGILNYFASPTIANGIVYVGSSDGNLYTFNATGCGRASCLPLWRAFAGNVPKAAWQDTGSSLAIVNEVAYIGSYDGSVYALNARTGTKLWSFSTGGIIDSSPIVANEVVYIGSQDHSVYALDAQTGHKVWSFPINGEIRSSPAVVNGIVYVSSFFGDGKLYTFHLPGMKP